MTRLRVAGVLAGLLLAGALVGWGRANPAIRTVTITIHFSHFSTSQIDVRPGETVRFVIDNTDPIDHEFIIGGQHVQQVHEKGTEPSHGAKPGEVSVPAGTTQVTTYTFPDSVGQLEFACHLPGHYAYGMHGLLLIR